MYNGCFRINKPQNESIFTYELGSQQRNELKAKIAELKEKEIEIPLIIDGKEVKTGNLGTCIIPHNHQHVLARYHIAGEKEMNLAKDVALKAKKTWESMPWTHRASIFLKAAELLAGPWRTTINAATMLCQSKNPHQAEIDAVCELIDFLRFNAFFMQEIYEEQPVSGTEFWNRIDYRPLEGFVLAITPFNFTAIAGNLVTAPAMLGNVVNWKPATAAIYSNYFLMKLLQEAGLPDGVINFIPSMGSDIGKYMLNCEWLAGIHFTGSTEVFNSLWKEVAQNVEKYKSYPRIVGETGGKGFIFAHNSSRVDALVTALIRGAFEYQGQKCSAASRAYIPKSLWNVIKDKLLEALETIKVGDIEDFRNFMGAVIDYKSFERIKKYLEYVKESHEAQIFYGGKCDDSVGYFIEPTVIITSNPRFKTMEEELFGPVLTVYIYDDSAFDETLELCSTTSPYGLTGAVFATDRQTIIKMEQRLSYTAGNFYINDKPTGAVVGQQPFGGSRSSGTNDKAGSKLNLLRWVSPRTIKETFDPAKSYGYPHMVGK
ncbi:1-pyrroline-5-carboxylate dehydrogenase [Anaerosolibacter carboniphilus]|uniref:L-glutamate gamma-semialdehyde dehydrogenase n=1 Tax=Anaerosolibacter carboniphilus TaxID=1417629 RepID=A0A841KYD1_9FIRM|nr:L-glutamate gamma-semialdehyde dehydrogenase [Anaerosolibacter carboniphilus]MBB6215922.1 1-pyrroline-5-carboxylate dehydrogenase [Anaerosolibacter carboniphilus]